MAVALALLGYYEPLLRARALPIVTAAQPHAPHTLYLLQTVPGRGTLLSLVLLYELHDIPRFPRGQAVVSYCRLGKWAKESAGQRDGTAGNKRGQASLTWAFSAAAVLLRRDHPAGQKSLTR
jgi:transposase